MKKEATTLHQPFIPANMKVWLVFYIKNVLGKELVNEMTYDV